MNKTLVRDYLVELLGTFALVYVSAGVVCVSQLTTPRMQDPALSPITSHQPGLLGIVLAQAAAWTVLLVLTVPVSGGYLNPAITLMLGVFRRLTFLQVFTLLWAQILGAVLAGLMLRNSFSTDVLREIHFATPHLNPLVYGKVRPPTMLVGGGIEVILTFFLVLAIFGTRKESPWPALLSGAWFLAAGLVVWPLTGAAANPARWLGSCSWEALFLNPTYPTGLSPWQDAPVYLLGPLLGSLLAGSVGFWILQPALAEISDERET